MTVIAIDGPEKAGKTTIINSLVNKLSASNLGAERVHWGRVEPDDRAYKDLLKKHSEDLSKLYVWDRCWPSEYVYGALLNRKKHRMSNDPWIGEWLHGRALQANGLRVIVAGPHPDELIKLRDSTDLNVRPDEERYLYISYAQRFGWKVIFNSHTEQSLSDSVQDIYDMYVRTYVLNGGNQGLISPTVWAGFKSANIVVVGDKLSNRPIPGGWLPFTSHFTTLLGREFGDTAMRIAWTNADTCPTSMLSGRTYIVTCGKIAHEFVMDNEDSYRKESDIVSKIISIPHPSYMYRYNNREVKNRLALARKTLLALMP